MAVISQIPMACFVLSATFRAEHVVDPLKMNAQVAQEHRNTFGSLKEPAQNLVLMVVSFPIPYHFIVLTVTQLVKPAVGLATQNV